MQHGGDADETGTYEVPAGGRRFRALELLVTQKKLAKTAPVPCVVREAGSAILAEDDSLAENVQRVPLHPLDQFRAFSPVPILTVRCPQSPGNSPCDRYRSQVLRRSFIEGRLSLLLTRAEMRHLMH